MYTAKDLKKMCSNFTVLMVDDEKAAREQVYNILALFFPTVFVAKDGVEALEIYKEKKPHLVITDLTMPRMGGIELVENIRAINKNQKIIVVSAHTETDILVDTIKNSVDGYILKPIEVKQLFQSLGKVVTALELERANERYQKNLEIKVDEQAKKLIYQLEHDPLTHIPNKAKLEEDFQTERYSEIILFNIDNFSLINSAYGYEVGDILLQEVVKYLQSITNQRLYRIASDEFVIALVASEQNDALTIVQRVQKQIYKKQFIINEILIRITFSMGIVKVGQNESRVPYAQAKQAIYKGRQLHKNIIWQYNKEVKTDANQKEIYEWALKTKEALENNLLVPYYQPIINITSKEEQKYECLARIEQDGKAISPYFFIEPAKTAGIITNLTRAIISKAFQNFSATDTIFSINITDDDFKESYLIEYLQEQCKLHTINPRQVILEILENINDYDAEHAIAQIDALKEIGFQISIDDFGAESSNFSRVQKLNVDYIKIDGGFIKDVTQNHNSLTIVKTIIYYAKQSHIKTVAEFVHDEATYNMVKELGVDYAQGYYFSEPLREIKKD